MGEGRPDVAQISQLRDAFLIELLVSILPLRLLSP